MSTQSGASKASGKAWHAGSGWSPKAKGGTAAPGTQPAQQAAPAPGSTARDWLASYLSGGYGGPYPSIAERNAESPRTVDGQPYQVAPDGPNLYPSWYGGPRGADVLYQPGELPPNAGGTLKYAGGAWDVDRNLYNFRNLMPGIQEYDPYKNQIQRHPYSSRRESDWSAVNSMYQSRINQYNTARAGGKDPWTAALEAQIVGQQAPQTAVFGKAGEQEYLGGGWNWDRSAQSWDWDPEAFDLYEGGEDPYAPQRRRMRNDD